MRSVGHLLLQIMLVLVAVPSVTGGLPSPALQFLKYVCMTESYKRLLGSFQACQTQDKCILTYLCAFFLLFLLYLPLEKLVSPPASAAASSPSSSPSPQPVSELDLSSEPQQLTAKGNSSLGELHAVLQTILRARGKAADRMTVAVADHLPSPCSL